MKLLASVVSLVLIGLVGGWLWMDATAEARGDSEGVVITGAVDPATATSLVGTVDTPDTEAATGTGAPADGDAQATATATASGIALLDQVVTLLGSSSNELVSRADDTRQAEKAAADKAKKEAEDKEKAEAQARKKAEQEAQKRAEDAAKAERKAAEKKAVQPIPVQPAPVSPYGGCEWDDDDAEWDCDDDWDDDDDDDDDDDR